MLGYAEFKDVNRHPVLSYFKSEYKEDWEYQYEKFLADKKVNSPSLFKRLQNFFYLVFPTDQEILEKKLSECNNTAEVESILRENDRKRISRNFLDNRRQNFGLTA